MKIVVLDGYTLSADRNDWRALDELGETVVYDRTEKADIVQRARQAEVLLTNKCVIDRQVMEQLPELKYIGVLATGYNIVDIQAAAEKGIVVTNVPAYSTESVAQMVFAHILNLTQQVGHYAAEVRDNVWSNQPDFNYRNTPVIELAGKRIGIVGFGRTGAATARLAAAFGMEVAVYTSKPESALPAGYHKVGLDELFASSDVVSLHCPLNQQTAEMVNASRLAQMKQGAILINTGRGGLVDEAALAEALKAGRLLGAGLDVLTSEPPAADHPLIHLPNCFITPHIAWATAEARARLLDRVVENIKAWVAGSPVNVVG